MGKFGVISLVAFAIVIPASSLIKRLVPMGVDSTMLQRTLDRMQWWSSGSGPKEPSDQYVLFVGDDGGPNNIRIGWEMTGLVAFATNRTFVLPPAKPMYLLDWGPLPDGAVHHEDSKTRVEDLINLQQLKAYLPTLTFEEFMDRTGLTWDAALAESERVADDDICKFPSYESVQARILYMPGDGRREGFSCGEWFHLGGPRESLRSAMTDSHWALLTHGFVWHPDVFDIAARVVDMLGIFNYNAIHVRYNDFQFHEDQSTPSGILDRWGPLLQSGSKLYIASDEPEKVKMLKDLENIEVVMFQDVVESVLKDVKDKYSEERWFKLIGPVEELICTYAKIFVGTPKSSFSGHIHRMRVHAQAPVTDVLFLKDMPPNLDALNRNVTAWQSRKYHRRDSSSGDVFLQLAINDNVSSHPHVSWLSM